MLFSFDCLTSNTFLRLTFTLLICFISGCKLTSSASDGGNIVVNAQSVGTCPASANARCELFPANQQIELDVIAAPDYEFVGWSGDCKGMGFCRLTMNQNHVVRAEFQKSSELTLHDTDASLKNVLENGKLDGSCDRWAKNPDAASPYLERMCGKWMFFYEGFNIMGVPTAIAEFMVANLPDTIGEGFSKFGLITDPYSASHLPLGLAPGATVAGAKTLSFTCASCHFAQTPDGRYSAGLANHNYDYGKQIIALNFLSPLAMLPSNMLAKTIDSETINYMQPIINELNSKHLKNNLMLSSMSLTGLLLSDTPIPTIPKDVQRQYLAWKKGTQDFVITPVGQDDHVETVSKMLPLWDMYSETAMINAGGPHAMLGLTGSTSSYDEFLQGFVALSNGNYPTIRLRALKSYLLSLKAPASNQVLDADTVAAGKQLFESEGCAVCHNGPSHSSTRTYSYEEIGTDAALAAWADPDMTGTSVVPKVFNGELTHQVKSPRLVGLWAQQRFLHNGSVDSLEELFCVNQARPTRTDQPFGDQGHRMTCDGLTSLQKQQLIAYLKSL